MGAGRLIWHSRNRGGCSAFGCRLPVKASRYSMGCYSWVCLLGLSCRACLKELQSVQCISWEPQARSYFRRFQFFYRVRVTGYRMDQDTRIPSCLCKPAFCYLSAMPRMHVAIAAPTASPDAAGQASLRLSSAATGLASGRAKAPPPQDAVNQNACFGQLALLNLTVRPTPATEAASGPWAISAAFTD